MPEYKVLPQQRVRDSRPGELELGRHGRGAQLVLIGKDGGIKTQQSEGVFDLECLFELIAGIPMRRAEMPHR